MRTGGESPPGCWPVRTWQALEHGKQRGEGHAEIPQTPRSNRSLSDD